MPPRKRPTGPKPIESITHDDKRANLPTADAQEFVTPDVRAVRQAVIERDPTLDPQLVWKGKYADNDPANGDDLVTDAPPIYIQEKIDPRVLIENLRRTAAQPQDEPELTLFDSFDGLDELDLVDFYEHQANWSNRMILGDSLQVMASLGEREELRGQVQMIYIDPPYGIKFGSNWQASARKRDVKDGKVEDAAREAEQIKAFRDTWQLGIHSYLAYLRDRLLAARELLTESGSCFVQIGDENVHLVRSLMDEVFGSENFVSQITFTTTGGAGSFAGGTNVLPAVNSFILWFARDLASVKYRQIFRTKGGDAGASKYTTAELPNADRVPASQVPKGAAHRLLRYDNLTSQTTRIGQTTVFPVEVGGKSVSPSSGGWKTNRAGMDKLQFAHRIELTGRSLSYVRYLDDFPAFALTNNWSDVGGIQSRADPKVYVVQTASSAIERCMLMCTDPGDLVLDPTCGSGTTAYVAEQWGRRWITIDTSRVALALARQRLMGSKYPMYLLADSKAGREKEGQVTLPFPAGGVALRSVIDGQQRLSTVQLLLRGLLDVVQEVDAEGELKGKAKALIKMISNDEDSATTPEDVYKLWPRRDDRGLWPAVMSDTVPSYTNDDHLYLQARQYFADATREALADTPESERGDRLRALVDAVDTLFKIVVIDLDKNDDAQVIFEVLNGRQTELSASDLVKNLIFLRAEFAKAEHLEELYDRYWAGFDDKWWKKKVGTGHAQRYRGDVLLSVWLTATTASDVSVGNLYGEVRGYLDREKPKTEELLADLKSFATAYEEIYAVLPVSDQVIRQAYDRLIELNNLTAIPVLAWMRTLPESVLSAEDHRAAVQAIESFTVRRMIAGWTTRNYGATFVKVMKDARAAEPGAIRAAVVEALAATGWPTDPELRSAMETNNFYAMAQFRQRLVLGGIDQRMRANDPKQAPATVDYARLQIEHVLPGAWASHWPLPADLDEISRLQARDARDLAKNRIGNLTLVTQHFNGSVSNLGWESKQPEFAKQSSIMLNVAVAAVPNWDEDAIDTRAAVLAAVAATVWPSAQALGWLVPVEPANEPDSGGEPQGFGDEADSVVEAPEVLPIDLGASPDSTLAYKFDAADLPKVGMLEYRQGGDYKPAMRVLESFAVGNPMATAHVKALVHLGWVRPGGLNNESGSTAFHAANTGNLPAACWTVGGLAAPQISANMRALQALGAPEQALDDLWAAYKGKESRSTP